LNAGERLQTFPYPTIPRLFPHSKAFTVNAQTLLFESVTDKQKTTKTLTFLTLVARDIRDPPNLAW